MSTTTDTTTEQVAGSVEYIDPPQALEFEDNVRDQVELDKEFLASLRELGVIVPPIIAVRDTEGRTLVREGQCRTLGAREVGLSSVPVYVLPTGGLRRRHRHRRADRAAGSRQRSAL